MNVYELDVVTLTQDFPVDGVKAGAIGTVVHVFHKPSTAYEVEFVNDDGSTIAMITVTANQLRPLA